MQIRQFNDWSFHMCVNTTHLLTSNEKVSMKLQFEPSDSHLMLVQALLALILLRFMDIIQKKPTLQAHTVIIIHLRVCVRWHMHVVDCYTLSFNSMCF